MSNEQPRPQPWPPPDHWKSAQTMAIFYLIEDQREQLWLAYGPTIQRHLRADLKPRRDPDHRPGNSRQLASPFEPDEPF